MALAAVFGKLSADLQTVEQPVNGVLQGLEGFFRQQAAGIKFLVGAPLNGKTLAQHNTGLQFRA